MPPPKMSKSVSTVTVSKLAIGILPFLSSQGKNFGQTQRRGFGEQIGRVQASLSLKAAVRYRCTFGSGADREFEAFDAFRYETSPST